MAYRTDGTANFNFFINRQGPRGPQGMQGPEGFSPNVQVEEDQGNTFTLRITNKDNFFITSNLREHKEDRGGDYIRYDRAGQLMYIGDPNFATTVKTGEVRLSTVDDLTAGSDTVALTPKVYKDDITNIKTEIQGDITATNLKIDNLDKACVKLSGNQVINGRKSFNDTTSVKALRTDSIISSNENTIIRQEQQNINIGGVNTASTTITSNNLYFNDTFRNLGHVLCQETVAAGDNVAIEKTSSGIKISSTAQGDVTLAGDNSFTGNNTFDGVSTFNGDTWVSSLKVGTSLTNQQDKKFLVQGSVTAGDNISIEETTEGVKISSTGGGSPEPPADMVTTDTEQTITGVKTFSQDVNIQGLAKGINLLSNGRGAGRIYANKNYGGIEIYGRASSSDTWKQVATFFSTGVLSVATGVDIGGKTAYHVGNLIAGDGIELTTVNGVTKIAFTGGGSITFPIATTTTLGGVIIGDGLNVSENGTLSAQVTNTQYGQILESLADLSTKIDNLTTRLNNLEEVIDGGIA